MGNKIGERKKMEENDIMKEMLETSKRMYEKEIRSMENKISWYERQLRTIENSIDKLSKNRSLLIPKKAKT